MGKIGLGGIANYVLGMKGPVWIPVDTPWIHYNTIPQLKKVIDRKAMMFSGMNIIVVDQDDKPVKDEAAYKLLTTPNPLQSQNDFLKEHMIQKSAYGTQFTVANRVSMATYPLTLFNVSPRYLKPVLTGKLFDQVDIKGIIERYDYFAQGMERRSFDTDNVMMSKLPDLDNPIIGLSPVNVLRFPLTNIKLGYEFQNVVMAEKGALGILSQDKPTNDGDGIIPMDEEERIRIEKHYQNKYGIGIGQSRVLVTEASVKWQAMTMPMKDYMLLEQTDAYTREIIDQYGMNQHLFSSLAGTTYENVKNSMIMVYSDTIQPEADLYVENLGKFIRLKPGFRLKASYTHLSILKENKLKGMAAIKEMIAALTQAIQAGLLDRVQAENLLAQELAVPVMPAGTGAVLNKINSMSPLVATNILKTMTLNEARALAGLPELKDGSGDIVIANIVVAKEGPSDPSAK